MAKDFITIMQGMSGYFACHMWLNEEDEDEPFWEPYESGIGRYSTREEALVEAAKWADEMEMELRA